MLSIARLTGWCATGRCVWGVSWCVGAGMCMMCALVCVVGLRNIVDVIMYRRNVIDTIRMRNGIRTRIRNSSHHRIA